MALFEGFFATALKWLTTSTFGKAVASLGLSLIGSLVLGGLSRPPVRDDDRDGRRDPETSLDGNVLRAGSPLPRVLGSQRLFPPLMAEPLLVFESGQEVVEGIYGLAGPHDLEDIRIAGAPVASMPAVEVVTRDGTRRQRPQRLLRRYGFTEQPDIELAAHQVESDGVTLDLSAGDIAQALPQPQLVRKVARADELWLQLVWQQGLHREVNEGDPVRVPIRLRARRRGDTEWRRLPELHFRGRAQKVIRATVRLIWQEAAPATDARAGDGFVEAFRVVPAGGGGWEADASFDGGSGADRLNVNNVGTTRLRRAQIDPHEARLYLAPSEWEPGEWEVEVIRGHGVRDTQFNAATYQNGGTVRDLFGSFGTPPRISTSRAPIQDGVTLARSISVVNATPSPDARVATIAVRARGVRVEKLSVKASGLVRRWEGDPGADSFYRSDNPADLFHDVLASPVWANPVRPGEFDLPALLEWRSRCAAEGWRCNAVAEDMSMAEVLRIICGAGYARPRMTGNSVIQDYDRAGDAPVHVFTPRNSGGLAWRQSRADLPSGLRVTFRDAENEPQEIIVWAGTSRNTDRLEAVEYESVQTEAEARARALYDLRAGKYRRTVYALEAPPAAMALLPGSMVDVILPSDVTAAGVIRRTTLKAMGIDGAGLAFKIEGTGEAFYVEIVEPVMNTLFQSLGLPGWGDASVMADLFDMRRAGLVVSASIQQADGSWETYDTEPVQGETQLLRLVGAPSGALRDGAEVAIRVSGRPERMVIADITPAPDLTARVVMVPDASTQIWGAA